MYYRSLLRRASQLKCIFNEDIRGKQIISRLSRREWEPAKWAAPPARRSRWVGLLGAHHLPGGAALLSLAEAAGCRRGPVKGERQLGPRAREHGQPHPGAPLSRPGPAHSPEAAGEPGAPGARACQLRCMSQGGGWPGVQGLCVPHRQDKGRVSAQRSTTPVQKPKWPGWAEIRGPGAPWRDAAGEEVEQFLATDRVSRPGKGGLRMTFL